jgi:hypothetical protein
MKRMKVVYIIVILASLASVSRVIAQAGGLTLRLSRDFGYGGLNDDIQGTFSMKVSGPADLARVVFYIDGNEIGEVTQLPFSLQFKTDNYTLGRHELSALGLSLSGQEYRSNIISSNFVSAAEGSKAGVRIILPVLGVVFVAILLSFIVPIIASRGKNQYLPFGAERKYGMGGGICPKCHRPFALPNFSLKLGLSKLARCHYCGKWSAVRIQPKSRLREAEQAELEWGKPEVGEETEEEKLRKRLDDSKFQ